MQTALLFCWRMVYNQTNTNRDGNDHVMCRPPAILLENGSMVHNQIEMDTIGNPSTQCFHGQNG